MNRFYKIICTAITIMLCINVFGQAAITSDTTKSSLDSASIQLISEKVSGYLNVIVSEPVSLQKQEVDFLINTCTDSLTKQAVALKIYEYYITSKVMGVEAVAIHICDNWFSTGKIKMHSDMDLMTARMYAEFNRNSLIGMKAPELHLMDSTGCKTSIFSDDGKNRKERYSILFFYSTDCPKCLAESIMLRNIIENKDPDADFYAIYTGRNKEEWQKYIRLQLDIHTTNTRIYHLWDPHMDSGFQMKYGLLQTPGLFLTDSSGKIAGRKLDAVSLDKLMNILMKPTEYGSEKSAEFYDSVFAPFGSTPDSSDIESVINYIEKATLENGDTLMYKQMTGDLLYYLAPRRERGYKYGLDLLIKESILGKDIWSTRDDSLKICDFALMMKELLDRNRPTKKIHDTNVMATRLSHANTDSGIKEKNGWFKTGKSGNKDQIIIFHTSGCEICKTEIETVKDLVKSKSSKIKNTRILLINMNLQHSSYPEKAQELFDTFDLLSLPFIIKTDSKGIVTDRYMSFGSR